jgi:ABC-2 type transport system permease protein
MFAFFLMPILAEHLLKEKEEGSLRRLVAAPVSRGVIIGGKVAAYMVVVILQVALIFGIANIVFKMPLGHSPLGLFLVTVGAAAAATALGMMIAALSKSKSQASSVGLLLVFVLAGLGGSIQLGSKPLPLYRYDNFMGVVSRFTPHAQALEGYMRLLADNAGAIDVLPQTGILLAMAAIFFFIAVWRFKFEG